MKLYSIEEPDLEFGGGTHIDVRFGIASLAPLDFEQVTSPKDLVLGLVGTTETTEQVQAWLQECSAGVEAKSSRMSRLFPAFPGCTAQLGFLCELVFDQSLTRHISKSDIEHVSAIPTPRRRVERAVSLFFAEIEFLVQNTRPKVVICAPPLDLLEALRTEESAQVRFDFHHLLKARAMALLTPIQIILVECPIFCAVG